MQVVRLHPLILKRQSSARPMPCGCRSWPTLPASAQPDAKRVANDLGLPQFEWIESHRSNFVIFMDLPPLRRLCGVNISRHGQSKGLDDKPECRAGPLFMVFRRRKEVGEVHSGFTLAVRHSWEEIANAVDKVMPRPSSHRSEGIVD